MSGGFIRDHTGSIRFDTVAAILGLLGAMALLPLRFLSSQIYIRTIPLVLGAACLCYLYAAWRETSGGHGWPTLSPAVHRALLVAVFLGLAGLVVLAVEGGARTPVFLDLAGIVGTVLFVQIAFVSPDEFDPTRVLLQIVLLAAVVRLAALYTNPGLIGIDIWTHITQLAQPIYDTGSIDAIDGNKHFTSPLYHVLVAVTAMLGDVPLRLALYLSLGVVMPLSVLLVYATGSLLVDRRWAAFGALAFALSDYAIEWGIHLIPTSMGLALFLAVTYWLVRLMRAGGSRRALVLLVGFSVATILTHQVSTFIMMVLLGSALLAYLVLRIGVFSNSISDASVYRRSGPVNVAGLLVFDAGLITALWAITPYDEDGTFLVSISSYLAETIASSASFLDLAGPTGGGGEASAGSGPSLIDTLVTYIDVVGFLLLLFLAFVGCLYVVHRKRARQSTFTLLIASAIMMVFTLGLPIFGIRNFVPPRWFAFLYAPLVLLGIIALRYLSGSVGTKLVVAVVLIFALIFPTAMVVSMNGNIDNPVFEDQEAALAFSEPEVEAVDSIGRLTGSPGGMDIRPDQALFTDYPYRAVFDRTAAYPADTARINDTELTTHDVVVYRATQSEEATYFLNSRDVGEIRNIHPSRLCRPEMATIYSNRDVQMCVTSPAT